MTGRVAITGATGYLGSYLARALEAEGYSILALARRPPVSNWRLGARPDLRGCDVLIHCAHSFDSVDVNIRGTSELYAAAQEAGVSFIVFISSMAAFPGCASTYGRTKMAIEEMTAHLGGISIRPGTIWGGNGGGLMRSIEKLVRALPVVPLIGRGAQRLYLVNIEDLSQVIRAVLMHRQRLRGQVLSVAHQAPLTFRELLRRTARRIGARRVLVPVPSVLVRAPLQLAEAVGVHLPLRSDSVNSLTRTNPAPDLRLPDWLTVTLRPYA